MIDNLVMKKCPKGFYKNECNHVDESIRRKFSNSFPFGNKLGEGVKVFVDKFLPHGRIVHRMLNDTHKNEIKH
jgi:hypothetical protein